MKAFGIGVITFCVVSTSFASEMLLDTKANELHEALKGAKVFTAKLGDFAFNNGTFPSDPVTQYLKASCEKNRSSHMGGEFFENSAEITGDHCGVKFDTSGQGKFTLPTDANGQTNYYWNSSKDPNAKFDFTSYQITNSSHGRWISNYIKETKRAKFQFTHRTMGAVEGTEIQSYIYCTNDGQNFNVVNYSAEQIVNAPGLKGHVMVSLECDPGCSGKCSGTKTTFNGETIPYWSGFLYSLGI